MRSLRPVTLAPLAVILAILVVPFTHVHACRCGTETALEILELSDAVFTATVSDTMEVLGPYGPIYLLAHVTWIDCWKGDLPDRITVITATTSAGCGVAFEPGVDYLIYGVGRPDSLYTDTCWRTRPLDQAQDDIMALGPPKNSVPALPASWGWIKQKYSLSAGDGFRAGGSP